MVEVGNIFDAVWEDIVYEVRISFNVSDISNKHLYIHYVYVKHEETILTIICCICDMLLITAITMKILTLMAGIILWLAEWQYVD